MSGNKTGNENGKFGDNGWTEEPDEVSDFYYSAKQDDVCMNMDGSKHIVKRFKGIVFSEQIGAGVKSSSTWDDFVKIGTGTQSDCTYQRIY